MKKSNKKFAFVSLAATGIVCALSGAAVLGGTFANADAVEGKGTINVYLIGGQSNAVGYGQDTDSILANEDTRYVNGFENVLYYGEQERSGTAVDSAFQSVKLGLGRSEQTSGAEIGIAASLAESNGMNAVIKCAWGATHIYPDYTYDMSKSQGTWTSPSYIAENNVDLSVNPKIGAMYNWFLDTVTTGISLLRAEGYTPVIKGMWWMQGEAEMFTDEMSSKYDELLTALIADVRTDVSSIMSADYSQMPFVLGLPSWNDSVSGAPAYENAVRENMQLVANNADIVNVASVDCEGLEQHDMWHFDAASQKWLGEQFVQTLDTLNEGKNADFKESVSLFDGAKIRTNEPIGIRFGARLANYNVANNYKYGMLIIPTDYLTSYQSQIVAADYDYVKAFADNNIQIANMTCYVNHGDWDKDGIAEDYIQGSLVDIKYDNINRPFTGIAYIYDTVNDCYLYTSATVSRSVSYVASASLFDYESTDSAYASLLNYVYAGINKANGVAEEYGYATTELTLNVPQTLTLNYGGAIQTKNLEVTQEPNVGYYVEYSSQNEEIATVDEFGTVTPISVGETTITVKCLDMVKTIEVVVDYEEIEGVKIDGVRDESYGEFTDTVKLNDGRYYNVSAVKTENGVSIYTQALFNTTANVASWASSTDFEFKLNANSAQCYVALGNKAYGVTQYVTMVEEQSSKYLHTFEFFVHKDQIPNWTDDGEVQLNYAWKSPGEQAAIIDDMIALGYLEDWGNNSEFHAYHRLGGLSTGFNSLVDNLKISANGLTVKTPPQTEAVLDADFIEYPNDGLQPIGDPSKATVAINGKSTESGLYLALTITHGAWSNYSSSWWNNDNVEMYVNDVRHVVMFLDGNLSIPAAITNGVAVTKTVDGKQVTKLELYFESDDELFNVRVGINGTGFGGWQPIAWGTNGPISQATIGTEGVEGATGILVDRQTTGGDYVTLDGNFVESVWTQEVMTNHITATANGAQFVIVGTKTVDGIYLGVSIFHSKPVGQSTTGATNYYNYMNVEFRLNGSSVQLLANAFNKYANNSITSYCFTEQNDDGTYTSIYEIYVTNEAVSATQEQASVTMAFAGWFESGWAWVLGGNSWTATHSISANGITKL